MVQAAPGLTESTAPHSPSRKRETARTDTEHTVERVRQCATAPARSHTRCQGLIHSSVSLRTARHVQAQRETRVTTQHLRSCLCPNTCVCSSRCLALPLSAVVSVTGTTAPPTSPFSSVPSCTSVLQLSSSSLLTSGFSSTSHSCLGVALSVCLVTPEMYDSRSIS